MADKHHPAHIAFILDGNRRWARERNLPVVIGHKRGYERAKELVDSFIRFGIRYVTYFLFSSENWTRSKDEVDSLINLFRDFFNGAVDYFNSRNIKVKAIGDLGRLPSDLAEKIRKIEEITENNDGLTLLPAISYSGRDDLLRASKKVAQDFADGKVCLEDINADFLAAHLDTAGIPDPDILVRTSERRISNFLLWQCAYSEIFFVDKYWPEFNEDDLKKILEEFSMRNRRYGR